jgi:hypothetical protein
VHAPEQVLLEAKLNLGYPSLNLYRPGKHECPAGGHWDTCKGYSCSSSTLLCNGALLVEGAF